MNKSTLAEAIKTRLSELDDLAQARMDRLKHLECEPLIRDWFEDQTGILLEEEGITMGITGTAYQGEVMAVSVNFLLSRDGQRIVRPADVLIIDGDGDVYVQGHKDGWISFGIHGNEGFDNFIDAAIYALGGYQVLRKTVL